MIMILPNWLENLTLDIFENATEEATNVCLDYWKMEGGEFVLNTDQILKKYDIENIHKLIFLVNTNSRFFHVKECAEQKCHNSHAFSSRSEFKAGINTSVLTKNFPYYEKSKYRKTTSILELFENEKWYCTKHAKEIEGKRIFYKEAQITSEWRSIKEHLEMLLIQFDKHDIEIGHFNDYVEISKRLAEVEDRKPEEIEGVLSNRNYMECFKNELFLDRRNTWLLFCDYWLLDLKEHSQWVFSEIELCRKYKIKISELRSMIDNSGDFMPLIYEKYTEQIIKNREKYFDAINDSRPNPVRNDKDNLRKFNDSTELADQLRRIAKTLNSGDAYYLSESATHIEGMYSHYKELVNRGNQ